ncbi:octaprenyl-diphosphate synthase [Candidatus Kuenenia stuttgartiensis]|uniref:Octaprenyl-diphosphate synthase n=2 Tax=Kuenenia stuttgartiensis TaxID=174633 RepID=Q1Q3K6_KUEST|nr:MULTISPECIES: polyprenyl synthetase family protein [Kuenenia]MCF6153533.1 polyprenyl synthetase family protein [Candidatus Kuenenia stuttgartiensis]MCZ7623156.1 polyprenyl synthetase family protein [Candidatus Kuenenia sp.]QII11708.1 octaprenyl-diphosphate synthase [Candidatus Kuenenia stuttgartiensis]CAJ74596.1 similar to geranylgeranyl pyrophosphate (GGPP) synthetase [Candidatus Kuenenia stuttgartiensis]
MGIEDSIRTYGAKIDDMLRELIPVDEENYLSEPIWYHMNTKGKRVRPAICLITCEALGGNPENALSFALAIEVLHNMFLMHDDIEDGDTVRRDQPTVWVKYGTANAINAGDYLLACAYKSTLASPVAPEKRLKLLEALTLTYGKTVEGQALDINARAAESFTVAAYMKMVELKTGYYLACGMVGGAIVAGASNEVVEKIWMLGKNMGPAFQIRDDLIDLTHGKGRGGVIGSDIKEGKASFLYSYVLQIASGEQKKKLREIMLKPREETTADDIEWVLDVYRRYDAMKYAQDYAENLVQQAYKTINEIPVDDKTIFKEIASFMAQRMS